MGGGKLRSTYSSGGRHLGWSRGVENWGVKEDRRRGDASVVRDDKTDTMTLRGRWSWEQLARMETRSRGEVTQTRGVNFGDGGRASGAPSPTGHKCWPGWFWGGEEPLQDSSRSMTQLAGTSIGQTWTAPGTSRPQERGTRGLVDWWAPDVKVGRN